MDKLLPCPFCGNDVLLLVDGDQARGWWVECEGCYAEGPWDLGRSGAIAEWNTRAPNISTLPEEEA